MCRDHHQHSELFQNVNRIHDERYHPFPLDDCVNIDNILAFPQHKTCSSFALYLEFLAIRLSYALPWSITIFYVKKVMRIAPPLKISWYSDTSHHHHSFLAPMLILTGILASVRCCLDSVLLATLLL